MIILDTIIINMVISLISNNIMTISSWMIAIIIFTFCVLSHKNSGNSASSSIVLQLAKVNIARIIISIVINIMIVMIIMIMTIVMKIMITGGSRLAAIGSRQLG